MYTRVIYKLCLENVFCTIKNQNMRENPDFQFGIKGIALSFRHYLSACILLSTHL